MRFIVTGVPNLRAKVAAFGLKTKTESHLVAKQVAILKGAPFGPNEWGKGNKHLNAVRALNGGEAAFMAYNNLALSIVGAVGNAHISRDVTNTTTMTTRTRQKYYFSI